MRKGLIILTFSVLILSFQNCAQHPHEDFQENPVGVKFSKVSLEGMNSIIIWDYEHGQFLDLDPATGRMKVFEEYGYLRGDEYCLDDLEKSTLKVILKDAEICEPEVQIQENQACTMEYRYPYVSMSDGKEEIKLGEKTSGCDSPTDLCGDKGAQLKSFVSLVLATLKSHTCQ